MKTSQVSLPTPSDAADPALIGGKSVATVTVLEAGARQQESLLNSGQCGPPRVKIVSMGPFLIRTAFTGLALWLVTMIVPGIDIVGGDNTLQRIGIILVVAVIFGLVNAIIKPIVQILAIPLYILTLGLVHIAINALMLWITSWITDHVTHWGLFIDEFWWTAIWGAIVLSLVGWALGLLIRDTVGRAR